jgi:Na+-driven multidrug efflux pump
MAAGSYTDAMSIALLISAGMGIAAAIVSGLILGRRQPAGAEPEAARTPVQEPLI